MSLLTQDVDDGGQGESSDHGNGKVRPRIVRIGTHKDNNFRSRISEHFLLNESAINFTDRHQKSLFENQNRHLRPHSRLYIIYTR
jgi:hypothetical protein